MSLNVILSAFRIRSDEYINGGIGEKIRLFATLDLTTRIRLHANGVPGLNRYFLNDFCCYGLINPGDG